MDALAELWSSTAMTATYAPAAPATFSPDPDYVARLVARRSFANLATVSPQGRAHVAGVLYQLVDGDLYVSTDRSSRKARNIAANPHAAVTIPVRRVPVGPPSQIQFQATAEILDREDSRVRYLVDTGRLAAITSHGELDLPDGCILRITPSARLHTYGLGMSLLHLIRHPLDAAGVVWWDVRST